ncbi:hypothetical protein HPC49_21970 [Pyxidicoccus fallax]|uniref:Uncharacterized protein n=1 Tax=Pyxidicoccus fallax TaxID=394095 RepID=A0A848LQ32_9BACT|nr:hypothetical protein [Pyxidicoccus fallax]NMO20005.1 hypothetical protein [Pyxidicoccus fallax]NPC80880.1 hypothetical protein [Pyxidicoccus fallax]
MSSVFELLEEIRKRPAMYVGGEDSHRVTQLRSLEHLLNGYSLALHHHGIREPVADFNREFGAFLSRTRGWSASAGPVAAIREAAKSDADAWELFWTLVDEFRDACEARSR